MKILMGTFVQITVFDNDRSAGEINTSIDSAFVEIERIDKLASNWTKSSELANINLNAASDTGSIIGDELRDIIKKALYISRISNGTFDITVSPLIELWKKTDSSATLPEDVQIQAALQTVGYRKISLDGHSIHFSDPNTKIDLGGIAKGYAVDKGMDVLMKLGIKDALINAGGDFKAICSPLTMGKRKVWIKHPRLPEQLYGYFKMDNGSVATSGDYERFSMIDSTRYHHILDPRTGFPATKSVSVTIMTDDAMIADAFATAVFILGPDEGLQLIETQKNLEGLIIYKDGVRLKHVISSGLKKKFVKS